MDLAGLAPRLSVPQDEMSPVCLVMDLSPDISTFLQVKGDQILFALFSSGSRVIGIC